MSNPIARWLERRLRPPDPEPDRERVEASDPEADRKTAEERHRRELEGEIEAKEQIRRGLEESKPLFVESPSLNRRLDALSAQIEILTAEARAAREKAERREEEDRKLEEARLDGLRGGS